MVDKLRPYAFECTKHVKRRGDVTTEDDYQFEARDPALVSGGFLLQFKGDPRLMNRFKMGELYYLAFAARPAADA